MNTASLTTRFIQLIGAATLSLAAAGAFAQSAVTLKDPTATPRIDQRQANQANRINQGVQSGQLTPQEQAKLQNQQNRIAADEAAAKADGKVTRKERKKLTREENRASANIYRKKHNNKVAQPGS